MLFLPIKFSERRGLLNPKSSGKPHSKKRAFKKWPKGGTPSTVAMVDRDSLFFSFFFRPMTFSERRGHLNPKSLRKKKIEIKKCPKGGTPSTVALVDRDIFVLGQSHFLNDGVSLTQNRRGKKQTNLTLESGQKGVPPLPYHWSTEIAFFSLFFCPIISSERRGLLNPKSLRKKKKIEIKKCPKRGTPSTVALVDIDLFFLANHIFGTTGSC